MQLSCRRESRGPRPRCFGRGVAAGVLDLDDLPATPGPCPHRRI